MTDTTKEAVELLAHDMESRGVAYRSDHTVAATLRQLITERDAEKARADGLQAEAEERECLQAEQDKFAAAANEQIADLQSQLTAANEKLASARDALGEIAKQKLYSECDFDVCDNYDWIGGYDACVETARAALATHPTTPASLCEDCPPVGYPTEKTRCDPCPRRTPANHEGQCDHSWHLYQPNGFSAVKERCGKCWEIRSIAEAFTAKESQP